jgi:hypothetical protein
MTYEHAPLRVRPGQGPTPEAENDTDRRTDHGTPTAGVKTVSTGD